MMQKIIVSSIVGLCTLLIVTEILSHYIFFSLFIGIPAGIMAAIIWYLAVSYLITSAMA